MSFSIRLLRSNNNMAVLMNRLRGMVALAGRTGVRRDAASLERAEPGGGVIRRKLYPAGLGSGRAASAHPDYHYSNLRAAT